MAPCQAHLSRSFHSSHRGVQTACSGPAKATSQLLCPNRPDPASGQSSNLGWTMSLHGRPEMCCDGDRPFPAPAEMRRGSAQSGRAVRGSFLPCPSTPFRTLRRAGTTDWGCRPVPQQQTFFQTADPAQPAAGPSPTSTGQLGRGTGQTAGSLGTAHCPVCVPAAQAYGSQQPSCRATVEHRAPPGGWPQTPGRGHFDPIHPPPSLRHQQQP